MNSNKKLSLVDVDHTFVFNSNFEHLQRPEYVEQKFFCETFTLIDSMRRVNVLRQFIKKMKECNGAVNATQIIQLLKDENLIDTSLTSANYEMEGLESLLDCLYKIIHKIVLDGYVSCMHTSSLGCLAWESGELYLNTMKNEEDYKDNNNKSCDLQKILEKGRIWKDFSTRLRDLAEYQRIHLKIHHDFQKSNYASDPRTRNVYCSTFLIILFGLLFMVLRKFKIIESTQFTSLLAE